MKIGIARGALFGILVGGTFGLTLGTSLAASTAPSMSSSQAAVTSSCAQKSNNPAATSASTSDRDHQELDLLLKGGSSFDPRVAGRRKSSIRSKDFGDLARAFSSDDEERTWCSNCV